MRLTTVLAAYAAVARAGHVLHERRETPLHTSWRQADRVVPDAIIPLRIGLKQQNLDLGVDKLTSISHPESEHYGKHLSAEEVHDLFAPSQDTASR